MPRLVLFNKPYGVLSQFSGPVAQETLRAYLPVPGVYPAGRLDKDSEGLLLLTDDGRLQQRLAHPRYQKWKTYWLQVEGNPTTAQLAQLQHGVWLKDGLTRPAQVRLLPAPQVWPREPPVRPRLASAWLELKLREGRNRQARRMSAAVGLPVLRLVRVAVGAWRLGRLAPGEYRVIAWSASKRFGQMSPARRQSDNLSTPGPAKEGQGSRYNSSPSPEPSRTRERGNKSAFS